MRRRCEHGFSLVESLVALAIAAVVMAGFYNALATGALLERRADAQAEKILLATTILDTVGIDIPLRRGTTENGVRDDLTWELRMSGTPTEDMQLGAVYPNELIFVSVAVSDPTEATEPVVMRAIRYAESPL